MKEIELYNDHFQEVWKIIPETDYSYQASSFGRIKSVDRKRYCKMDIHVYIKEELLNTVFKIMDIVSFG